MPQGGESTRSRAEDSDTTEGVEPAARVQDGAKKGRPGLASARGGLSLNGLLGEPGVIQRLACSTFAWAATVAPVAFSRSAGMTTRALAIIALASGVAGPMIIPFRKPVGRHIGITLFVASAVACWLLVPNVLLDPMRIDPILGAIGSLSWVVYALSWGEPWRLRSEGETEEGTTMLRARAELPPFAVVIGGIGVATALGVIVLAWFVRDSERAIASQAAGIGLAVALVSSAATVAVERGRRRSKTSGVPSNAIRAVIVLVGAIVLGAAVLMMRSK